jgi:iron complex outermembrane receptor protein
MNWKIQVVTSVAALSWASLAGAQESPEVSQAAPAEQPASNARSSGFDSNEIVVTATRRSETLQTVPISVSALSAEAVAARGITNVEALAGSVPNLAVRPTVGTKNAAVLTIRGQVQRENLATLDPSVGVYLDDVYLARAYSALSELLDVERVEVLRGPQGTLFGRNTVGGAVRVISRKADVDEGLTGRVTAEIGNYSRKGMSLAVSVPIVQGVLALRYAGNLRAHDGYTKSYLVSEPYLGPSSVIRSFDTNDEQVMSHRISLRFEPTPDTKLDASYYYFRDDSNGVLLANRAGDISSVTITSLNPFTFTQSARNSEFRAADFYSALVPQRPFSKTSTQIASATLEQSLSDEVTFKLIGSYARAFNHSATNASGIVTDSVALAEFFPNLLQRQKQYSAEAQLYGSSFGGLLDWITGVYYFKEKGFEYSPGTTRVLGSSASAVSFTGRTNNRSVSAFASGTISLSDRLKVRLGGRYTRDTKGLKGRNRIDSTDTCIYTPGPGITTSTTPNGPCLLDRKNNYGYFIYDAGVDFKVSQSLFVYAKTGNGYRSGGQQLRAVNAESAVPFSPEKVVNYEVGVKLNTDRFTANAALFHVDYSNVQQSQIISPPLAPTTTTFITNLGSADVDGFEIEGGVRLFAGLRIDGSVGHVKMKYKSGNVQPFSPKWQYSISPNLTVPVGEGKIVARVNYDVSSSFFVAETATPDVHIPGSKLLSARLSWEAGNGLEVALWGRNLTKEEYYTSGISSAGLVPLMVGDPRTYGASVSYAF